MCGITGFIDYNKSLNVEILTRMISSIKHRGPDGHGNVIVDDDQFLLGFGHTRLSILDLSNSGAQPMKKHNFILTFNGEIYNFTEIREELILLGYSFVSRTDTEVILSAFDKWGESCVNKFVGMFSIVIFDKLNRKVYFIRDRAGIKPMYYSFVNGLLVFGSELNPILIALSSKQKLSTVAMAEYFNFGYVSSSSCIFEGITKLKQGHIATLDLDTKQLTTKCYWNVFDYTVNKKKELNYNEYVKQIEEELIKACNYRTISDVPIGVFLSGGYDSTLVAALLQSNSNSNISTFTIGFEDESFDESQYALEVAKHLGTNHRSIICKVSDVKEIIMELPNICDEPFGDNSILPTYLVCKLAKEHVDVVLSADGGDEQFVGYRRYVNAIKLARIVRYLPRMISKPLGYMLTKSVSTNSNLFKIGEILYRKNYSLIPQIQNRLMSDKNLSTLFRKEFKSERNKDFKYSSINDMFANEYVHYMQDDILTKVDRASMTVSLEARVPLIDHNIAEKVMSIPLKYRYRGGSLKSLIKTIVHKYVPEELMNRPKRGFSIPFEKWLIEDFSSLVEKYMNSTYILQQDIFSFEFIEDRRNRMIKDKCHISAVFIWRLLCFQLWHANYLSSQNKFYESSNSFVV